MQFAGLAFTDHDLHASRDGNDLRGSDCRWVHQKLRLEAVIGPGLGDDTLVMVAQG